MKYLINYALVFLFLMSLVIFGGSSVVFDLHSTSQNVRDGEDASLHCGLSRPNNTHYNISWLMAGVSIKNESRRYQAGNGLYFRPTSKDLDADEFQCIATNLESGAEYVSKSAKFNFTWVRVGKVDLKRPANSSMIHSTMKSSVVLKCNITGFPQPQNFTWFLNQEKLGPSDKIIFRKDRLFIRQPPVGKHDGVYTCCTRNTVDLNQTCISSSDGFELKVLDVGKPTLIRAPNDVTVVKGGSAVLSCVFRSDPPPLIMWRKRSNKFLSNQTRAGACKRCIYPNGTMIIHNVKRSTQGSYQCIAKQGDYESSPYAASITLAYIYPFDDSDDSKVVTLGRNIEYLCETPKALPPPQISWIRKRDNQTINKGPDHVTKLGDTLVISNIEQRDLGTYVCIARNKAGIVTKNLHLTAADIVSMGKLLSQEVDEGANVTWTCPIRGIPNPEIKWLKDGALLELDRRRKISVGLRLVLLSVGSSDQGYYSCVVKFVQENSQLRSDRARLVVNEQLMFDPPLQDMCVHEGNVVTVNCSVNKDEVINFYWEKLNISNAAFIQFKDSPRISQLRHGRVRSLTFNQTIQSDSHLYRCRAVLPLKKGEVQQKIEGVIKLTVVEPPSPQIIPRKITAIAGRPLVLDCGLNNVARNMVFWNASSLVTGKGISILSNGSLSINRALLHHSGEYFCTYSYCGFETVAITHLRVIPDVPASTPSPLALPDPVDTSHTTQIIVLSVAGGVAYVLCAFIVFFYCRRRHRKKPNTKVVTGEDEKMIKDSLECGQLRTNNEDETTNYQPDSYDEISRLAAAINLPTYPIENINPVTVIGKGSFGDVFLSKAPGLFPDLEDDILVMVKALEYNDEDKRCDFQREITMLHDSSHENIVKLLAVCSKSENTKNIGFLVTEYLDWGTLKLCLIASRNKTIPKFTKQHKMMMCCQVACALDHLDSIGLHHHDVATRNCVVSSQLLVKLSVLSLTKEGFENEYCQVGNKRLPIRWMAPEALLEEQFSSKSDVWSFAVTCWEIFNLGDFPFQHLSNQDYMNAMYSDNLPSLPPLDGSKRITSLIKKCCQIFPGDRPDINQIVRKLQSIVTIGNSPDGVIRELSERSVTGDSDVRQRSDNG